MHLKDSDKQLTLLAEITSEFSQSLDINQILNNGIARIMHLMGAEAASIFLFNRDNSRLSCRACAGPGDICQRVLGLELGLGEGIVGRVAVSKQPEMVRDVKNDPDFAAFVDQQTGFISRSIIAVPLLVNGESLGAIEVINKSAGGFFDSASQASLSLLATAAALAIHSSRMAQTLLAAERMQRELELAREIQAGLLPAPRAGFPISGMNVPALEVSGDFYDFFDLADGRIGFNLADVSGKGINAALLGVKAATLLRSLCQNGGVGPGELLARVNDELAARNMKGMFITAIAGVFDPQSGLVEYSNAGHPPPILIRQDGGELLPEAQAPPLGVLAGVEYPLQTLVLNGADLYLYTDGLSESFDANGEELGLAGVMRLLNSLQNLPVEKRLKTLMNRPNHLRRDDITVVLLEGFKSALKDSGPLVELKVEAVAEKLALIRQEVREALSGQAGNKALVQDVILAVNEACMNVVVHAFCQTAEAKPVLQLMIWVDNEQARFEIVDNAEPSDFAAFQGRDLQVVKPGGLGLHFIREIMDEVVYSHLPAAKGNRLRMCKRF